MKKNQLQEHSKQNVISVAEIVEKCFPPRYFKTMHKADGLFFSKRP